jgi:hypothetical protein
LARALTEPFIEVFGRIGAIAIPVPREAAILRHELRQRDAGPTVTPRNLSVLELPMDGEIVNFLSYQPHFELTPYSGRPGWSVVKMIHRGEEIVATAAPGAPVELATMLRERARCPNDVIRLVSGLGLKQAA